MSQVFLQWRDDVVTTLQQFLTHAPIYPCCVFQILHVCILWNLSCAASVMSDPSSWTTVFIGMYSWVEYYFEIVPVMRDHLSWEAAFAVQKRWSLNTGSTVLYNAFLVLPFLCAFRGELVVNMGLFQSHGPIPPVQSGRVWIRTGQPHGSLRLGACTHCSQVYTIYMKLKKQAT